MVQVAEHLPTKYKALSLISSTTYPPKCVCVCVCVCVYDRVEIKKQTGSSPQMLWELLLQRSYNKIGAWLGKGKTTYLAKDQSIDWDVGSEDTKKYKDKIFRRKIWYYLVIQ
jgi:hypothetical protein